MKTRAAVAWEAKKPHTIETIEIGGPKAGEVLVRLEACGVCHTDMARPAHRASVPCLPARPRSP